MIKKGVYEKTFKRPIDFFISLISIIILSPIIITLTIIVKIKLGSPVIFQQLRPGKNEELFTLYKFRSMSDRKDSKGELLPDSERITKFGSFLRKSSLDELPSLFNILKGDLSIVGPRPLLVKYLSLYNGEQKRRHEVRPGLTGLAQISGRNALSWDKKFEYDLLYIDNISFKNDLMIIIKTIKKVILREGITSEKSVTSEEFRGNIK